VRELLLLLKRNAHRDFLETAQKGMKEWRELMLEQSTRLDKPMKPQVVAFVGDGGFSMLMAEFATCVKYELPVKVVIVKNNTLGQIKWEQMVFLGNPEYGCELHPMDFALFAKACGGSGFTIENPADCGRILAEALSTPGPAIVEGIVDPFEPPLPAKVTMEQAAHFAKSLLRGEPNREKIALTVLAGRVRELI